MRICWSFISKHGTMRAMSRRDSTLAVLVAVLWGFNFVVIDWGMDGVPPLLFLTIRFVAVLVPAVFLLPRPEAPWRAILTIGALMSFGQFAFLYVALDLGLPSGVAALVLQAQIIFTVIIAAAALRERPRPRQIVGVVVGSLGLLVMALGRGGDVPLLALATCLAGAASWGAGNVVSRSAQVTAGLSLTVWSALVVPIPALLLSLAVDGPSGVADGLAAFGPKAAFSTLYTAGLASLVGYGIFNTLLSRNAAVEVVSFILLTPVVAIASGALLLDRVPNRAETLAAAVMVIGVLVALRSDRDPRRTRPTPVAAAEVGPRS